MGCSSIRQSLLKNRWIPDPGSLKNCWCLIGAWKDGRLEEWNVGRSWKKAEERGRRCKKLFRMGWDGFGLPRIASFGFGWPENADFTAERRSTQSGGLQPKWIVES